MTDTTKSTRPGALALEVEKHQPPLTMSGIRFSLVLNGSHAAHLQTRAQADAIVALIARCERAERHAEAMADALDRVSRIAWHPEAEGAPALHNAHRWQVVEVCRAALAAYRAERGK